MSANLKISENPNFTRNKKGQSRFAKGNKIGRMKKRGYTLADLTKVAIEYDKTHDETILKHYINQLKKDNRLLENFINRYVPMKTISELTGAGGEPIEIIKRIYSEDIKKE